MNKTTSSYRKNNHLRSDTLKSIVFTIIWTILLVVFGVFISFKAEDFASRYNESLNTLEMYVKGEDWKTSYEYTNELKNNFNEDSKFWFKLLNHCHLGDIELSFNILSNGIYLPDIGTCLDEIESIKIYLLRMIESEKHNLDHIL